MREARETGEVGAAHGRERTHLNERCAPVVGPLGLVAETKLATQLVRSGDDDEARKHADRRDCDDEAPRHDERRRGVEVRANDRRQTRTPFFHLDECSLLLRRPRREAGELINHEEHVEREHHT